MAPRDAKTLAEICELGRDSISWGDYALGFNSEREIYLSQQKVDEPATQSFVMPRHVLEKFIRWYDTGSMAPPGAKEKS